MFKFDWARPKKIETSKDIEDFIHLVHGEKTNIVNFDTETTGLNIVIDKPFMFQVAVANQTTMRAFPYTVDYENNKHIAEQFMLVVWIHAKNSKALIGHNIGYDLHMSENVNLPYTGTNIVDTAVMIRLASDAIPTSRGGSPLGLTAYAKRHVDPRATDYERMIRVERSKIAKNYNAELSSIAKEHGMRVIDFKSIIGGAINDVEDLPLGIRFSYKQWLESLPSDITKNMTTGMVQTSEIPYNLIPREVVELYGAWDVIYGTEIYHSLEQVIRVRKNTTTFEMENKLIPVLVRMERQGFQMNKEYIESVVPKLDQYIRKRRKRLDELAGQPFGTSQHKLFKEVLEDKYNIVVESTGKDALKDLISDLKMSKDNPLALEMISTVQELRRLEKWYGTYLLRFNRELELNKNVYTTLNQAGAVTGRFSSDFQQFPNGSIYGETGEELYQPRAMVEKHDESDYLVFIDYSQIELRIQALYTILIGEPDLNMCRAYMPYQCYSLAGAVKTEFNFRNISDIENFGDREWFHNEDNKPWHAVDVHAATTMEAFPHIDPKSDEFKSKRNIGKTINFSKNYGAGIGVTRAMFKDTMTEEEIVYVDGAYFRAFPGIKKYQQYCQSVAGAGFMTNLFGRRYYGISAHNGMNALVQGTAADLLKLKMIDLDEYIIKNELKSKMIMTIHDELVFSMVKEEIHHVDEFVKIMEHFEGSLVPIVAEIEFTKTTWADAQEAKNAKDIIDIDRGNGNN